MFWILNLLFPSCRESRFFLALLLKKQIATINRITATMIGTTIATIVPPEIPLLPPTFRKHQSNFIPTNP